MCKDLTLFFLFLLQSPSFALFALGKPSQAEKKLLFEN
jgi:hypothetical protein